MARTITPDDEERDWRPRDEIRLAIVVLVNSKRFRFERIADMLGLDETEARLLWAEYAERFGEPMN